MAEQQLTELRTSIAVKLLERIGALIDINAGDLGGKKAWPGAVALLAEAFVRIQHPPVDLVGSSAKQAER